MEPLQPIHSDRPRLTLFRMLSPTIAVVVVLVGLLSAEVLTLILGVVFSIYWWFTTHTRYELFPDRLVIHYGRPRQRVLTMADIEEVRLLDLRVGGSLLHVRGKQGQSLIIRPSDPELFVQRFDEARRRPTE